MRMLLLSLASRHLLAGYPWITRTACLAATSRRGQMRIVAFWDCFPAEHDGTLDISLVSLYSIEFC